MLENKSMTSIFLMPLHYRKTLNEVNVSTLLLKSWIPQQKSSEKLKTQETEKTAESE